MSPLPPIMQLSCPIGKPRFTLISIWYSMFLTRNSGVRTVVPSARDTGITTGSCLHLKQGPAHAADAMASTTNIPHTIRGNRNLESFPSFISVRICASLLFPCATSFRSRFIAPSQEGTTTTTRGARKSRDAAGCWVPHPFRSPRRLVERMGEYEPRPNPRLHSLLIRQRPPGAPILQR